MPVSSNNSLQYLFRARNTLFEQGEDPGEGIPFISEWDTTKTGSSANNQITLPLFAGQPYDFIIDWGDGSQSHITSWDQAETTHTYASSGVKICTITSFTTFSGLDFNTGGDRLKITNIIQWGDLPFSFDTSKRESILLINTTNTGIGATGDFQFKLPLSSAGSYNFYVDWGDGQRNVITAYNQSYVTHTYAQYGMYAIKITGVLNGWSFNNSGDKNKLLSVVDFGESVLLPNVAGFMYGASWLADAPTEISSWTQLAAIQTFGCYKLTRNLTTADADYATVAGPAANGGAGWLPIAAFSGTLDGMNYSIDGLTINRPSTDTVGLIATAGSGLVISNLNLTNVSITGQDRVGALIGYGNGSPTRVINCTVQGAVAGRNDVGGFCGHYTASSSNSCRFLRCTVYGTVTGTNQVGGIWGYTCVSELFVESCISHADVTGTSYVGGFGGCSIEGAHYFFYSFARGLVTGTTNKGGLIGKRNGGFSRAIRSYWDIEGTGQAAAGDTPNGGDPYVGLTTAQMQGANAPINMPYFDWTNIHQQEVGYPSIRIQSRTAYTPAVRAPKFAPGLTTLESAFYATRLTGASMNVGAWNTSGITNMSNTFRSATLFNQNIGGWDVSNVTSMSSMFNAATVFNQNIGVWNTSKCESMSAMFSDATAFNNGGSDSIKNWDTHLVTNMNATFQGTPFNQPIGSWDVGNVLYLHYMFDTNSVFNQDIGAWDVSAALNMSYMFRNAAAFNQNIGSWNTSKVTLFTYMFQNCYLFNQDISGWDVRAGTAFDSMFSGAKSFRQDLSAWTLESVSTLGSMFASTILNNALDTVNIDNLFRAWSQKNLPVSIAFDIGTNNRYGYYGDGDATIGRQRMVAAPPAGLGWTVTATSAICTFSDASGKLLVTCVSDKATGTRVRFKTSDTLPTGLSANTDYWTRRISSTTSTLATSLANALANTTIDYTDSGTGLHDCLAYGGNVTASDSSGVLLFTFGTGGAWLGDAALTNATPVRFISSGSLPTGISADVTYYTHNPSGDTYQVAPTILDAMAGTNLVAYTDAGSGNIEMYRADAYSEIFYVGDNGDYVVDDGDSVVDYV